MEAGPFEAGTEILGGRFRALRSIRHDRMLQTHLGLDKELGGEVVIKTIADTALPARVHKRLTREATALRERVPLDPQPLLAWGVEEGRFHLVAPFVHGKPLGELLHEGPLAVQRAVTVVRCILEQLAMAHAQGVLHRNIKPANVILDEARATLIDYGLSPTDLLQPSTHNVSVHAVRYLSPEQSGLIRQEVDARSDLYAAGLLLFECLAGCPPYSGSSVGELLQQHLNMATPSLRSMGIRVPRALDELVRHLLPKEPTDRYQTATATIHDLRCLEEAFDRGNPDPDLVIGLDDQRHLLTDPAFVGRREELAQLERALGRARRGEGGLVTLLGSSGSGKSVLLQELAQRAASQGQWVLRGEAVDRQGRRPFQLLEGVIHDVVLRMETDPRLISRIRGTVGDLIGVLCTALPRLARAMGEPVEDNVPDDPMRPRGGDACAPCARDGERARLAIYRLIQALGSEEAGAVVLLDNCQWADQMVLQVIEHWPLAAPSHVLVVTSFRSDDMQDEHPLQHLQPSTQVVLAPLAANDIRQLVCSMAGPLPPEALEAVIRLARGNPFMAAATLWGLVESGALIGALKGWQIVSEELAHIQSSHKIAAILTERLKKLRPEVRQLLEKGAVLGHAFDVDQVAAFSHLSREHTAAMLDDARRRHLVWVDGQGTRWHFMHSMLRESLLSTIPATQARRLHLRAAQQLIRLGGDSAFEIAYHLDAGGASSRALMFALEAAEQAQKQYAIDVAEQQYRIAERGARNADRATRLRVVEGLGEVLVLCHQHQEAQQKLDQALSLCDNDLDRARILGALGKLAYWRGENRAASVAFEEALRLLDRPTPKPSRWALTKGLAQQLALRQLRRFRPLGGGFEGEPTAKERLVLLLHRLLPGIWWHQRGMLSALWSHLFHLNLAERFPSSEDLGVAYAFHGRLIAGLSLFGIADRYCERSEAICRRAEDPWIRGQNLYTHALVLYASSRFDPAMEKLRRAIPLLERVGDAYSALAALGIVGCIHLRKGDLQEAEAIGRLMYEDGVARDQALPASGGLDIWAKASGGKVPVGLIQAELKRATGDLLRRSFVQQAEAVRLLRKGRPERAAAILEGLWSEIRLAGIYREHVFPVIGWWLTALRLRATHCVSPSKKRARLLSKARRVSQIGRLIASRFPNHQPHVLRECGLLAFINGETTAARYLDRSIQIARAQGAQYELAQSLLARGQVGRWLGLPNAADDEEVGRQRLFAMGADFALGEVIRAQETDEPIPATLSLADRYDQLLEAGHRITTSLSREAVFAATREAAINLIRGQHCLILEIHEGAECTVASGSCTISVSDTLVHKAVGVGTPVVAMFGSERKTATRLHARRGTSPGTGFAQEAGRPPPGSGTSYRERIILSGVRSALAAPIPQREEIRYCLYMTHEQVGGLFGEEEERLAGFLASLAGAALENAQIYTTLESAFGELKETHQQLKSTQGQLVQAAKLAALGQLGAGIAHELNQPIQSIQGFAQRILRHAGGQINDHLDEMGIIVNATHRMARIVQNIRLFARDSKLDHELIDPTVPVEDALMLLGRQLERLYIEIRWERDEKLPEVMGDAAKLQQVFLNLLLNAGDALAEIPLGPRRIVLGAQACDGGVRLSVRDNGPGVPPELESRIFDPFFTTKEAGSGTGLGLSISYGIIKEHGGELLFKKADGGGACFTILLPCKRA